MNSVHQLRRLVRRAFEHRGLTAVGVSRKSAKAGARPFKRKPKVKRQHKKLCVSGLQSASPAHAEATEGPWAKLAELRDRLIAADLAGAKETDPRHNLLYAGVAARARRNGQW
jgi:hypothetical protein